MKKAIIFFTVVTISMIFSMSAMAGPAMDRIIKKGELVVGTSGSQPPIIATTKKGNIVGLDADISKAMADALNVKLKFIIIPFPELLPALEAGQVDMILSGMTMTPKRNVHVAFVGPYLISGKGILTLAEKYAALKQAEGLNSPEVAVATLKHSTSQEFAETIIPEAKLILINSYDEALELLLTEQADVIVADYPFCALMAYRYRDKGLFAGESPLTYEPIGIAMAEDTLLINWVQNFLITLQGSGKLKKMSKRWLKGGSWIEELP